VNLKILLIKNTVHHGVPLCLYAQCAMTISSSLSSSTGKQKWT